MKNTFCSKDPQSEYYPEFIYHCVFKWHSCLQEPVDPMAFGKESKEQRQSLYNICTEDQNLIFSTRQK
ncbi:hypothetical protein E2C01_029507 [Portunus trituberculatus]|uniref:Uncharacterized protein n=1 Tax=Portunus trituberculatus TaxID=210409 RepID=A0A5B7ENL7_PORTR|nr:hypothetical protein [Portunus trituberculatus]